MPQSEVVTDANLTNVYNQVSPTAAIDAVEAADEESIVVVDFDETLFLRNSTEEYLDSIYPRPAGACLLLILKVLKPWRLLPSRLRDDAFAKDWCLVVAATLFFPWTLLVWRYRAKSLAKKFWNQSLVQAMHANPRAEVVVATLGFDLIVKPLLRHLPVTLSGKVGHRNIVACRFWQGPADRAKGKLAMVQEVLGAVAIEKAVAITDSDLDQPLLESVSKPCLVVWPEAEYVPAMSDVYLPLFYSEKVKNPNKSHFMKRIVMGHWAFLAIALSFLSPHPWLNAASLFLLVVSYWCIYEIGYQENDSVGEKYEKKPVLSKNYDRYKSRINLHTAAPWYWATAIALPAILMIEVGKIDSPLSIAFESVLSKGPSLLIFDVAVWLLFLVAVRLTFWIYNQFNEEARIWIYPILQIQKFFGFTLLVGISAVGSALLIALTISRWLHYAIYRYGGDRWRFPLNLGCFLLFIMLYVSIAMGSSSFTEVFTLQAFAATGYCLIRSIKGIKTVKPLIGLVGQELPKLEKQKLGGSKQSVATAQTPCPTFPTPSSEKGLDNSTVAASLYRR
ncbi:MAG: HAD family hydrolase [Cyanobacteria bacterium P01_D01_bin.105]